MPTTRRRHQNDARRMTTPMSRRTFKIAAGLSLALCVQLALCWSWSNRALSRWQVPLTIAEFELSGCRWRLATAGGTLKVDNQLQVAREWRAHRAKEQAVYDARAALGEERT